MKNFPQKTVNLLMKLVVARKISKDPLGNASLTKKSLVQQMVLAQVITKYIHTSFCSVSQQKKKNRFFVWYSIFVADNMVGKGGYAEVYRGILSEDGQAIAVKVLTRSGSSTSNDSERKEKEFLTEIGTLGHVCHRNVTALLGCCIDNGLYLIFQFSSKGSVASVLHGIILSLSLSLYFSDLFNIILQFFIKRKRFLTFSDDKSPAMDWKTRHKIAIGTAKGLHYLHKRCPRRIIHRDIKTSNVLLTADFEPQVPISISISMIPRSHFSWIQRNSSINVFFLFSLFLGGF